MSKILTVLMGQSRGGGISFKRTFSLMICTSTLAFSQQAMAQVESTGQAESSDSQGAVGGEIIVTARKADERLVDIPLAVTAVNAETLERSNINDAQDLAPFVPNFSVVEQQSPGVAFINVRGIGQARFGEPPISVVVDGVQISNSYQITQRFADVESVEVLKGPQGALYGRNAIGGAMVITTSRPDDYFTGSVELGYGTADNWEAAASIRGPLIEDKLGFKFAVDWQDFDGDIINEFTGRGANFREEFNIRSGLYANPTDNLQIDLIYSRLRVDAGGAFYGFPAPDPNQIYPWSSPSENFAFRNIDDVSLNIELDTGPVVVTSISGYSKVKSRLDQNLLTIAGPPLGADQRFETEAFTQELRLASPGNSSGLNWMVGGYFSDIDFDNATRLCLRTDPLATSTCEGVDLGISPRLEKRNNYSVFGQFLYRFDGGLELTAAFRYEKDKQKSFTVLPGQTTSVSSDAFQPRISAAYFFNPDSQIYVSAAKGFRAAGFNGTGLVTATYEPETVWTYEAGYKVVSADRSISFNLAAFYNDISNRQFYQIVFQPVFDQVIANPIESATAYGLEADVLFRPDDRLTLQGSIGLINTNIDDWDPSLFGGNFNGNELPNSPELSYSFVGQYEIAVNDEFSLTPRLEVNGKSSFWWEANNNPTQKNDAIHLVNIRMIAELNDFSVTGYVENLFDKEYNTEYIVGGFGAPADVSAAAPGRRWGIKARLSF